MEQDDLPPLPKGASLDPLPPLPKGAVLDPEGDVPPLPKGAVMDTPSTEGQPPAPGMAEQLGTAGLNLLKGVGAGAISTARGLSQLAHKAIPAVPEIPESYATPPPGVAGQAGKILEQGAEFLLPTGLTGKAGELIEGAERIPGALKWLAKGATEAVPAAAITGAQTGGDVDSMKTAALLAGGTQLALPLLGKGAAAVLGKTTGAGSQALIKAAEGSPEFTQAMRGGTTESDILDHLRSGAEAVKNERSAAYQQQLANLPANLQLDLQPVRDEMMQGLKDQGVRMSVGQNGEAVLDFSRSTIRDPDAQKQVLGLVSDVHDWGSQPGDLSPLGVDTLKRRVGDMYSPSNTVRALVGRVQNRARSLLIQQVPGYQQMTAVYAKASRFVDNLKELSLNAKNDGTAIRKFGSLMDQNNDYRQALVDQLSRHAGRDLMGEIAGNTMSNWMPGKIPGIGSLVLAGLGLEHVVPFPVMAAGMASSSPRLVGEAAKAAGQVAPFVPKTAGALPSVMYVNPHPTPTYAEGGLIHRRNPDRAAILRSLVRQ